MEVEQVGLAIIQLEPAEVSNAQQAQTEDGLGLPMHKRLGMAAKSSTESESQAVKKNKEQHSRSKKESGRVAQAPQGRDVMNDTQCSRMSQRMEEQSALGGGRNSKSRRRDKQLLLNDDIIETMAQAGQSTSTFRLDHAQRLKQQFNLRRGQANRSRYLEHETAWAKQGGPGLDAEEALQFGVIGTTALQFNKYTGREQKPAQWQQQTRPGGSTQSKGKDTDKIDLTRRSIAPFQQNLDSQDTQRNMSNASMNSPSSCLSQPNKQLEQALSQLKETSKGFFSPNSTSDAGLKQSLLST